MTFVYTLDRRPNLSPADLSALIGGKAAGLAMMAADLNLPVPPAFAITTEACRSFLARGWPDGLEAEMRTAMRALEASVGRGFGDPPNPLLVSVRSGASVSMPGMMDTILNLGLNDQTTAGLATMSGDPRFADDCRRRFVEMFTRVVGVEQVPDDPWRQLRLAVEAVFRSWNSERALAYRRLEAIPDDLGTAVTVQAMVFGNRGPDSATGVMFTRDPATGEPTPCGDVLFASQGEDVVAGTHWTEPFPALAAKLPQAAAELRHCGDCLERQLADMCDIEFTIEQGKLWLLQVRAGKRSPRAALRIAVDMAEDPDFPLSRDQAVERTAQYLAHPPQVSSARPAGAHALAKGLPASPGVGTGEIATSAAATIAAADAGRSMILVRSETSPADVPGMARAAGVLTSRGGLVSHAAVVARAWGVPAVVGAEAVRVTEEGIEIGTSRLRAGDVITIDGGTGEIFAGRVSGTSVVAPEAATLLRWAKGLGIVIGEGDPKLAGDVQDEAILLRSLLIKGTAAAGDWLPPALDTLHSQGLVEIDQDDLRLTAAGKNVAEEQLAADRSVWGMQSAEAALEAFGPLDHTAKEAVTAWQLRDVDGTQAINDHSDVAYDAGVLKRLSDLQRDAAEWLSALTGAPAGLGRYITRLERAVAAANRGDGRFVASPRVDSFHSVWFELHEELILLAGRSRADEAAAGRA